MGFCYVLYRLGGVDPHFIRDTPGLRHKVISGVYLLVIHWRHQSCALKYCLVWTCG